MEEIITALLSGVPHADILSMIAEYANHLPFEDKYEHTWMAFAKKVEELENGLRNFVIGTWVTDCDDNRAIWADYCKEHYKQIESCFMGMDIALVNINITDKDILHKISDIVMAILDDGPYDGYGKQNAYWRFDIDWSHMCNHEMLFKKIKVADDTLSAFLESVKKNAL